MCTMAMRSWLFVPGDSDAKLEKVAGCGSDVVIVDLEDAVAPPAKPHARIMARGWLEREGRKGGGPARWVRINPLDTQLWREDLAAVMPGRPDGVMVPKASGPEQLQALAAELQTQEQRHGMTPGSTRMLPLVSETPMAALAGAAILMGRSFGISAQTLYGDLFCLLAGILYAGYLLILKDARKALGSWALLSWSACGSIPVLLAIALALGEPVWPTDWTPVIGLFISSQLIGQGCLVYALRHFSPLVIGIALLTQPAVGALAGWLSFGEVLTAVDLLGVALVGSALVLAKVGESTAPKPADTTAS